MDCVYCLIEVRFEGSAATMPCKEPAITFGIRLVLGAPRRRGLY